MTPTAVCRPRKATAMPMIADGGGLDVEHAESELPPEDVHRPAQPGERAEIAIARK